MAVAHVARAAALALGLITIGLYCTMCWWVVASLPYSPLYRPRTDRKERFDEGLRQQPQHEDRALQRLLAKMLILGEEGGPQMLERRVIEYADLLIKENFARLQGMQSETVRGPTVWVLWLQGWNAAPVLQRLAAASWIHHNDGNDFCVRLIGEADLSRLLPSQDMALINAMTHGAAKSDLARLSLLANYGGVWADATMLCMAPLASWVFDALLPSGLWMYHGHDTGSGPAIWFIVSTRNNYIIQEWYRTSVLRARSAYENYFWLDTVFISLTQTDAKFASEWRRVPYIWCESKGQSHALAGRCLSQDSDLRRILIEYPAYAYKLSRHDIPDDFLIRYPQSNASVAVFSTFMRPRALAGGPSTVSDRVSSATPFSWAPPVHPTLQQAPPALAYDPATDRVVVMADLCNTSAYLKVKQVCDRMNYRLLVYDKECFCGQVPAGIFCRPLRNVGREGGTFCKFVVDHYTRLPRVIIFLPGNLEKHDRWDRFMTLISSDDTYVGCAHQGVDNQQMHDFTLPKYGDQKQHPAEKRPFGNWLSVNVNPESGSGANQQGVNQGVCWNMVLKTTRDHLLRHPRAVYENIYKQLQAHNSVEVGHYVERAGMDIFGKMS